jgi:protein SCO1/2
MKMQMKKMSRYLAVLFVLALGIPLQAAELPGDSIYQMPLALVDQDGRGFRLANRADRPQLVSMFYTSCQYVCPLIIDTLKKTQAELAPAARAKLDVLLVSFDPARDTPERLKQVYAERKLDRASWTLARTDERSVRQLAALLGIQYRALANREINHSSALVLLDAQGRIVARTDKIGAVDAEFVAAVNQALAAP